MTANLDPRVAWDRPETDPCERGTVGCSVNHSYRHGVHPETGEALPAPWMDEDLNPLEADSQCETW